MFLGTNSIDSVTPKQFDHFRGVLSGGHATPPHGATPSVWDLRGGFLEPMKF